MKVLVIGDIHGHWRSFYQSVETATENGCEAVIQVGDLGYKWPGEEPPCCKPDLPVYFCDGNHENFGELGKVTHLNGIGEAYPGVFHVDRGEVLNLNERHLLFAGGAYSIDRKSRVKDESWWERETITKMDADLMLRYSWATIDLVVSHDCPFSVNVAEFAYPGAIESREYLDHVLQRYCPKYWFFGHYHRFYHRGDSQTGTTFFCLPCPHDSNAVGIVFDLTSFQVDDVVPIWS